MMDDIAEQQDVAKEISDAISNPVAFGKSQTHLSLSLWKTFEIIRSISGNDIDDEELERELDELEQEELDKELLNVGPSATDELPDVPSEELKDKIKQPKKKGNQLICTLKQSSSCWTSPNLPITVPAAAEADFEDDPDMRDLIAWSK